MSKLATILALAALAVGGYALSLTGDKDDRIESLIQANDDLQNKLIAVEARLDAEVGGAGSGPFMTTEATAPTGSAETEAPAVTSGLATRKATTPLDRLVQLEKTVAAQNEELAKMRERETELASANQPVQRHMPDNFYGNLDMAAKALELDERQKTDLQDAVDRGRRELDDLYAIESDGGETWDQIRKPRMLEGGGFSIAMPDMGKIEKFKKGRIPGSSETFGEAEKRLRDAAFGRMRNVLTPEQAKKWDKAHKEPLLRGGNGASMVFSSVVLSNDDGK